MHRKINICKCLKVFDPFLGLQTSDLLMHSVIEIFQNAHDLFYDKVIQSSNSMKNVPLILLPILTKSLRYFEVK